MNSLAIKLGSALVLVAVVAVSIMALLTNQYTKSEFESYVSSNPMYASSISNSLAVYYLQNEASWDGVNEVLPSLLIFDTDRLVLANTGGSIIGDTSGELIGSTINQAGLSGGHSIELSDPNTVIGRYFYLRHTPGSGGMGGGMGSGGMGLGGMINDGESTVVVTNAEADFLEQTNRWLWLAGAIAVAVAILIAAFLAAQISRPLKALSNGAGQIASGNLSHRVKVGSKDETGRLAESFNAMAVSLQKSEEARKRLLADVAHELRTPLTVINGTVDAMIDGVLPTDERQLGIIKGESALLTRLIADLRDLSLAEAGRLKLDISSIDLGDMVHRKLEQFRPLADAKNIGLNFHNPGELPTVPGDWVRLEQVLANLISNALRHTPEGGSINITLGSSASDTGRMVDIKVADSGEGIAPDELPHIFDRFYRIEDSRAHAEGSGAGLGLAIVKQMVEAHHGQVEVTSAPGQGTTFTISLPV